MCTWGWETPTVWSADKNGLLYAADQAAASSSTNLRILPRPRLRRKTEPGDEDGRWTTASSLHLLYACLTPDLHLVLDEPTRRVIKLRYRLDIAEPF
jgi:hypothetical protein